MGDIEPFLLRDFSQGRLSKDAISNIIVPENSVSNSINVDFDTVIGSAKVRLGTTKIGDTVASGKEPLGLGNFVGPGGSPNLLLAVHKGASTATLRYYDTAWHDSNLTALSNTEKNRFAVLGGSAFTTNSVDGMHDSEDGATWGVDNSIGGGIKPSVIFRYKQRLLAAGDPNFPDRVFFSSVVDPTADPFITWDTDPDTGDWIDINPDDGGFVTGFSETSTFCIVMKSTGMYRLDTVAKSADTENIFNVGLTSQEAIVLCQGVSYYFSGLDIRRTNGGYPEQISRLGVQDYVDAIPLENWDAVAAGTDGLNVYFSIGDVTLNASKTNSKTYRNVVLKFSPRDQTWSARSYADRPRFFAPYTTFVLDA